MIEGRRARSASTHAAGSIPRLERTFARDDAVYENRDGICGPRLEGPGTCSEVRVPAEGSGDGAALPRAAGSPMRGFVAQRPRDRALAAAEG
jgi:hypothetical protein